MRSPTAFCSLCTSPIKDDLRPFLLSLSLHHPDARVYLYLDDPSNEIVRALTPYLRLKLHIQVNLNRWSGQTRNQMELKRTWCDFQMQKPLVIEYALEQERNGDVLYLDVDQTLFGPLDCVDESCDLGVSPHYIAEWNHAKYGLYNGGMLWVRNKAVPRDWIEFTKKSRYYDQASIEDLATKYKTFRFGEECNVGWWRLEENTVSPAEAIKFFHYANGRVTYKGVPIRCVHTHFPSKDKQFFNSMLYKMLEFSKQHAELMIVHRAITGKWSIVIPMQPLDGIWWHNNDSFRELARMWVDQVPDLEIIEKPDTLNCMLLPNVCLYDRPTLQWVTPEAQRAHVMLLGNNSVSLDGPKLNTNVVRPWIFWARHPLILEDVMTNHATTQRSIDTIFIGNIENDVQAKYRASDWFEVVERFEITKGNKHKYTPREYLELLAKSRFGLCLRGYGRKCHREVELMALGTIPVVSSDVDMDSYAVPPQEGIHYVRVRHPLELRDKLDKIDENQRTKMSDACKKWFLKHVHSSVSWYTTIHQVLYGTVSST